MLGSILKLNEKVSFLNMMSPKKILIFLFASFATLALLSIVFPENGIKIANGITINFISFDDFMSADSSSASKDISSIIDNTDIEEDTTEVAFVEVPQNNVDSVLVDSQYVYYEAKQLKIDSVVRFLEFSGGDKTILHGFFEELATLKGKNKLIRIMHYGDSQIETDRMTNYLRYKLQSQFGGSGPGFVSAVNAFDFQLPMTQLASGNWKRKTAFGRRDTTVKHRRYGVLANFSRFSPVIDTSTQAFTNNAILPQPSSYKAGLSFISSHLAYGTARRYSRCRMFYGRNTDVLKVKAFADDVLISDETLKSNSSLAVKTWTFANSPKALRFEFEANDSPEFYGFAFDGYSGIAVDNIAMRGASGLMFTKMDAELMASIYAKLNTKLVILQFGGNLTPYIRDNYDFYTRRFSSQIKRLKRVIPGVTIIVIGPADMSKKENDKYISYPNIGLIRDALKQASFDNKCAYWDMFEAMGGENSMPSWVFNDPPLGEKDFTHFTPRGAKYIAKMFYNAFIYEYNSYLRIRKK